MLSHGTFCTVWSFSFKIRIEANILQVACIITTNYKLWLSFQYLQRRNSFLSGFPVNFSTLMWGCKTLSMQYWGLRCFIFLIFHRISKWTLDGKVWSCEIHSYQRDDRTDLIPYSRMPTESYCYFRICLLLLFGTTGKNECLRKRSNFPFFFLQMSVFSVGKQKI